ncbi:MAG TPA: hypothetical protein PK339_09820 [Flavitalea sp.]|nr:hypothetical protein [Flavitalea sp.]
MASRRSNSIVLLLAISMIIGTFLRISLLAIYPLLALFIAAFFKFRASSSMLLAAMFVGISFIFSLYPNIFLKYKLLSLYYMLPLLLLLFAQPAVEKDNQPGSLNIFFRCLTFVGLINNIIGLFQVIKNPQSDDSFMGLYTDFSVSLNGLVILNTLLFYYYFVLYIYEKKPISLLTSLFFLGCSILGFYGAGLVICLAAFILGFFRFELKSFFKVAFITIISLLVVYQAMTFIKPQTLEYNIANIKKMIDFDVHNGPRKLTSFYNYATAYPKNAKDFLLGSGPGSFNSRTAFMIGSPSYFTSIPQIKDKEQPYYFKHYAYSLWNESNTSQALYQDGFRNQPFSSILAFLGEYGLLFTLVFAVLYYLYYSRVARLYRMRHNDPEARVYFRFFKICFILLPLLFLIDNYFEYPEIMLLLTLSIKFSHAGLLSVNNKEREIMQK